MADVTANATVLFEEGSGEKVVLYRVKNVDTNDTVNVSTKFSLVKEAVTVCSGGGPVGDVAGISGTTVTIDIAAAVDETVYLLVIGNAA